MAPVSRAQLTRESGYPVALTIPNNQTDQIAPALPADMNTFFVRFEEGERDYHNVVHEQSFPGNGDIYNGSRCLRVWIPGIHQVCLRIALYRGVQSSRTITGYERITYESREDAMWQPSEIEISDA